MKRFIIRILAFLLLMFVIDRGVGLGMRYMQEHAKGGFTEHHNRIINNTSDDVLIFGSSRAIHHYNPQIIEDSLKLSCYNCGQNGNGIVLFYGWWQLIKNRHMPKIVIYDIYPEFDLLRGENNQKYLGLLRSKYENDLIKEIFYSIDPNERYKMQSMMYRYNSNFLQYILDYIHPKFHARNDGFYQLSGELDEMKVKKGNKETKQLQVDPLKLYLFKKLVIDMKKHNVQLIFVVSPIWYGKESSQFEALKSLRNIYEKHNILFLNYYNSLKYVKNNKLFKDGSHLNARGADEFTKELVYVLKHTYHIN